MTRRSIYFVGPHRIEVRRERIPPPGSGEVLVSSIVSAISAGTEMLFYRHQVEDGMLLDTTIPALGDSLHYPFKYGYATVGRVVDRGTGVPRELEDRLVFAFHPHESHFLAFPDQLIAVPEGIGPEEAAFLPSMETAASLVMDGAPLLGEDVVIIGQGVIGLLTTAILARMPLNSLTALERYPLRQRLSEEMGSERCLETFSMDNSSFLHSFGSEGADLIYELSGNPNVLDMAMKIAGFDGRIVLGSWYGDKVSNVHLGEAFHRKRLRIISSQVSSLSPALTGRWDKKRRLELAWELIRQIRPSRLITHRFDVDDAERAYDLIDRGSEEVIQILLTYGGE